MTILTRPPAGVARPYAFPRESQETLPNGLRIITITNSRLPVVTALLVTHAGAEADALQYAGLSALTASALGEGTQQLNADALAQTFEALGGELFTGGSWMQGECGITVLRERFDEAMRVLCDVIRAPRFDERSIDRLRHERLAELLQQQAEPRELADETFAQRAFEPASRYGLPLAGSARTVSAITAGMVREHYADCYGPESTLLIVVGDIAAAHVHQTASTLLSDWRGAVPTRPSVATGMRSARRGIHVVPKEGAPQTELRIGHTSLRRQHEDFYAVSIMNAILGGLFNSRINLNLRERNAFTYGASSSFDWRRDASLFEVATAVQSDVTAKAVEQVLIEIDRMRQESVADGELSLARNYITGVFPIRFESTAAIANAVATRECFELPATYYDEYRSRMLSVSSVDVRRVAEVYLVPERLQVVAVGDPQTLQTPLRSLGDWDFDIKTSTHD